MTRSTVLTDALIREALAPAHDLGAPSRLLSAVAAEVRQTPQQRPLVRLPWGSDLGIPLRPAGDRRLMWALAVVGLIVALLAAAVAGAALLRPAPRIERPRTGIETLTPETTGYNEVLVDGVGTLWATGPGHVTRFEPGTAVRRTWTVSDDLSFAAWATASARAGGIWLWSDDAIRRFDGTGFRESITPPKGSGAPGALAEAPGGSLWAASESGIWRWDGSVWVGTPDGPPPQAGAQLLVLADDDVWLGFLGPKRGVLHLTGERWATFRDDDIWALSGDYIDLAAAPDGSVWAASDQGLKHFADSMWTTVEGPGFDIHELAVDGAGAVWVSSGEQVARLAGGSWISYGPESGFSDRGIVGISANEAGVFLGTVGGLYQFASGRWTPAWPNVEAGPSTESHGWPSLLAVSGDEAWLADDQGLWHFVEGRWVGPEVPGDTPDAVVHSLVLGRNGALLAATDKGVAVRRDGRWTTAWTGNASSVTVAVDGSLWIAWLHELVQLRETGGTWRSRSIACPAGGLFAVASVDGSIWTGGIGYNGTAGLARYDGLTCEEVFPLADGITRDVFELVTSPSGGVAASLIAETRESTRVFSMWLAGNEWLLVPGSEAEGPALARGMAFDPSGDLWFTGPDGIERSERSGARHGVVPGLSTDQLSIAPDGALWFKGPSGIQRIGSEDLPR